MAGLPNDLAIGSWIVTIVADLLSNFKYGNLFEEMANLSENNNITIGFKMSLG